MTEKQKRLATLIVFIIAAAFNIALCIFKIILVWKANH